MRIRTWRTLNETLVYLEPPRGGANVSDLSNLCNGIVTLFGIQKTWAYFGPHHDICRPPGAAPHYQDKRSVQFWALVTAAHKGSPRPVRSPPQGVRPYHQEASPDPFFPPLHGSQSLMFGKPYISHIHGLEWVTWLDCVIATLTVAIRKGHWEIVDFLLRRGMSKPILCGQTSWDTNFWNDRTVLGTLFAVTADPDEQVSRVAAKAIRQVLGVWDKNDLTWYESRWTEIHVHTAMDIPTSAGLLPDVLRAFSCPK